jgi:hypothetical protein
MSQIASVVMTDATRMIEAISARNSLKPAFPSTVPSSEGLFSIFQVSGERRMTANTRG